MTAEAKACIHVIQVNMTLYQESHYNYNKLKRTI